MSFDGFILGKINIEKKLANRSPIQHIILEEDPLDAYSPMHCIGPRARHPPAA